MQQLSPILARSATPRSGSTKPRRAPPRRSDRAVPGGLSGRAWALGGLALGALALVNAANARRAERRHPPQGAFVTVDGVRLHYVEKGAGPPVLLIHGNGVSADDFRVSGLFDHLAQTHRVIAFDRPGFGYSERPRSRSWSAPAQADALRKALEQLGVERPLVVGHSFGALVALNFARIAPTAVAGLVLISGYYKPSARIDVPLGSGPAIPVVGDLIRFTVGPILGRLMMPMSLRLVFNPAKVTDAFQTQFPTDMSIRPSQLRAISADALHMIPDADRTWSHLPEEPVPALIIAGASDRIVDHEGQSAKLADALPGSTYMLVEGAGHMVHHSHADAVAMAIDLFLVRSQAPSPAADQSRPI